MVFGLLLLHLWYQDVELFWVEAIKDIANNNFLLYYHLKMFSYMFFPSFLDAECQDRNECRNWFQYMH